MIDKEILDILTTKDIKESIKELKGFLEDEKDADEITETKDLIEDLQKELKFRINKIKKNRL